MYSGEKVILADGGYRGEFIDSIFEQIESSIHTKLNKPAPKYFDRYGQDLSYVIFKRKSKQRDISYEVSLFIYCIFWVLLE